MRVNKIAIAIAIRMISVKSALDARFHIVRLKKVTDAISNLPDFPSIAATPAQFLDIYLSGARKSLYELSELCDIPEIKIHELKSLVNADVQNSTECISLRKSFEEFGSDKGGSHEYYILYHSILSSLSSNGSILEVGLGTNNISTPSNMGILGRPGASLKAWITHPKIESVVGADIDSRALFEEDGIQTFQLDQTCHNSWSVFKSKIKGRKFDLIVDDGLHSPLANIVTIRESLDLLTPQGVIVVEDIHERHLPIWRIAIANFPSNLNAKIIKCRKAYLLLIEQD